MTSAHRHPTVVPDGGEGVTVDDVLQGADLSRHHDPDAFHAVMDAYGVEGQGAVRAALHRLDSGRFYEVLDAAHKAFAHADFEGRKHLRDVYGDDLIAWIRVFGRAEDLVWRFEGATR